jgi:hypothetical protein
VRKRINRGARPGDAKLARREGAVLAPRRRKEGNRMRSSLRLSGLLTCALAALSLTGCFVEASPLGTSRGGPPPFHAAVSGTVTVTWTVQGVARPVTCSFFNAAALELIIYDASGREIRRDTAPCSRFTLTSSLLPGTYHGVATLIDARQRARTTSLPIPNIVIKPASDLVIDIDFPQGSRI